jgi:hypothetical protein
MDSLMEDSANSPHICTPIIINTDKMTVEAARKTTRQNFLTFSKIAMFLDIRNIKKNYATYGTC